VFQVNCISTEFTPKKHGGEKGVPFRIQVETFLHGDTSGRRLHAAACQIKVFKVGTSASKRLQRSSGRTFESDHSFLKYGFLSQLRFFFLKGDRNVSVRFYSYHRNFNLTPT